MIEISGDMVTTFIDSVSGMLSQIWVVMAPIYGIVIAFYVARKIQSLATIAK